MSDENSSLDELDTSQLSVEDLAVLQAFEDMDTWPVEQSQCEQSLSEPCEIVTTEVLPTVLLPENEEMLPIFAAEADEDVSALRQALDRLAEREPGNLALFLTLKRVGHKLHGTSGAVGFSLISTIAAQVELLAEEVSRGTLNSHDGVLAISAATTALEACLETLASTQQEPEAVPLLASLKTAYQKLQIDLQQLEEKRATADQADSNEKSLLQPVAEVRSQSEQMAQDRATQELSTGEEETIAVRILSEDLQAEAPHIYAIPFVRVDARRFGDLTVSVEKLVEQRAPVEDAQTQVEYALQALHNAQTRLQSLQPLIAKLQSGVTIAPSLLESAPVSSLVARILHEAPVYSQRRQRQRHSSANGVPFSVLKHVNANRLPKASEEWDELEIERYNERDILEHTLKDAIADLALATAGVQAAFTHFSIMQQDYLASITQIYRDTLLLRQAAFASIVPRLERVVRMSAPGRAQHVRFDVTGGEIEIDQDILDALATPLVQFLRTCLVDSLVFEEIARSDEEEASPAPHVWLKVINHGNRLTFELGFSMVIQGGAIEVIRQPIQQLHGTLSLEHNAAGGISFFLRIPHPHSSVVCLLVQAGDQQLLIPFNQIQRIGNGQQEQTDIRHSLQELLGFSGTEPQEARIGLEATSQYLPLLILGSEDGRVGEGTTGIVVDKILGEQEYIIKPLPPHLQRPGIVGTAIDGKGHVLLMVDILTLIRSASQYISSYQTKNNPLAQADRIKILVTDDSVALRHTIIQTLQQASYNVFEAQDGIDALEKLQRYRPDICLLDIEMPNLNGYDVLQMMSANPNISGVKVIMLTSRRATKYMQYALDLGARAYLTKPCTPDDLFQTIECVLKE